MKIVIIGWFGTETIGDRAILSACISMISEIFSPNIISLGSLNTFFTERTVNEDSRTYSIEGHTNINIFDATSSFNIKNELKQSDLLLMAGGPIMGIEALNMINYSFCYSKKNNIKNALLGISLGPLVNRKYIKKIFNILINSDLVIFRDEKYKNFISKYFTFEQQNHLSKKNFHNSLDLASFVKFNNIISTKKDKITINLRAIPEDYGLKISHKSYKNIIFQILDNIRNLFPNFEIYLIPMHYFFIGDDDRLFLNEIAFEYNYINLYVQNDNLTLEQTVQNFADSQFAIGNRFHSILLQSFFSDVSYKIDYTDPDFGKIKGFLDRFYSDLELKKTYFNLHTSKSYDNYFDFNFSDIRNKIDLHLLDPYKKIYLDNLSLLMAK